MNGILRLVVTAIVVRDSFFGREWAAEVLTGGTGFPWGHIVMVT